MEIELNDYQVKAINAVRDEFAKGVKSTVVSLPICLGVLHVGVLIAKEFFDYGEKVLYLTRLPGSSEQISYLLDLHGNPTEDEGDLYPIEGSDLVLMDALELSSQLDRWPSDYFDVAVCEISPMASGYLYDAIYNHFRFSHRLAVTTEKLDPAVYPYGGPYGSTLAFSLSAADDRPKTDCGQTA